MTKTGYFLQLKFRRKNWQDVENENQFLTYIKERSQKIHKIKCVSTYENTYFHIEIWKFDFFIRNMLLGFEKGSKN